MSAHRTDVFLLVAAGAVRRAVIAVATPATPAIKLDPVAPAGHPPAIASTGRADTGRIAKGGEGASARASTGEIGSNRGSWADVTGTVQARLLQLLSQILHDG